MKVLVPFYRGAVVFSRLYHRKEKYGMFSSPFIEERLYFNHIIVCINFVTISSRPLLSRSGCILMRLEILFQVLLVLVPFYRGAVVF